MMERRQGLLRSQQLNQGAPSGWRLAKISAASEKKELGPVPVVYAVISTWYEADIIPISIRICKEQGVDRIYVLDNDSPDGTADAATEAGAYQVTKYTTKFYDDDYRTRLQNEIVKTVSQAEKHQNLWWLLLDADELLPPVKMFNLKEYLSQQPDNVRVVGTNHIELYPRPEDNIDLIEHPCWSLSHGIYRRGGNYKYCNLGHWKHQLIRYNGGVFDIACFRGNHNIASAKTKLIHEPEIGLNLFHVPIRTKELAYARLSALCDSGRNQWDDQVTGQQGAIKRRKSLDAIFSGNWHQVEMPHTQMYGRPVTGVALYPWRILEPKFAIHFDGVKNGN